MTSVLSIIGPSAPCAHNVLFMGVYIAYIYSLEMYTGLCMFQDAASSAFAAAK